MSLLKLKDIGKIYVSEGNVTVGIRGVNLSFERGEFVAVTGKSGSGKTTLLNVISGMDSYEEGELFIDGQTTSHYLEPDWEEYREKYISFIFQDYNILESFTVLENVELALMHIEDKKARRERAIELLTRVGLGDRLSQKGSKLSGGQKQRTVIARALAKDSPVILADEPTGNLDSKTAKEIIELLREVSKDKLLIVVTHNFEQLEEYATRHVRIYDGAVEFDHVIAPPKPIEDRETAFETQKEKRKKLRRKEWKNGFSLGWTVFKSKPKLSTFLCLLLTVAGVGIFMLTSLCGDAMTKEKNYLFRYIEGRVVVTRDAGEPLTDGEVEELVETYGAKSALRYDGLLDSPYYTRLWVKDTEHAVEVDCVYGSRFGYDIVGRYPEAINEIFLYLPIYEQPTFGKRSIEKSEVMLGNMELKVVGVKYYYDNNKKAQALFTDEGFRAATSVMYLAANFNSAQLHVNGEFSMSAGADEETGEPVEIPGSTEKDFLAKKFIPAYDLPSGTAYMADNQYLEWKKANEAAYSNIEWTSVLLLSVRFDMINTYSYTASISMQAQIQKENILTDNAPKRVETNPYAGDRDAAQVSYVYLSIDLVNELVDAALSSSYRQASLFFENDEAAASAAEKISAAGYIAVPSYMESSADPIEGLLTTLERSTLLLVWLIAVLFLGLFTYLCTARAVGAFKGDIAVMRSMGISANVVRIAMYARMLVALIPAFLFIAAAATTVFLTPAFNQYFVYLYAVHYAFIFGGMLLLTVLVTRRQIRKLFKTAVKKSLKGGAEI